MTDEVGRGNGETAGEGADGPQDRPVGASGGAGGDATDRSTPSTADASSQQVGGDPEHMRLLRSGGLEEDTRVEAAVAGLDAFRARMLEVAGEVGDDETAHALSRAYCHDATLLRYLVARVGDVDAAEKQLQATLEWRIEKGLVSPSGTLPICDACKADDTQHCFRHIGNDARGFEVIYSCSARAANLEPQDGVHHIVCTLERVLRHNTMSKLCWIVDFNGFGWRHTDPRAGVAVVRALSAHYPERLGEVVLLNAPTVFWMMYKVISPVLDETQKQKIRWVNGDEARDAWLAEAGFGEEVDAWLRTTFGMTASPGSLPDEWPVATPPAQAEGVRAHHATEAGIPEAVDAAAASTTATDAPADAAAEAGHT